MRKELFYCIINAQKITDIETQMERTEGFNPEGHQTEPAIANNWEENFAAEESITEQKAKSQKSVSKPEAAQPLELQEFATETPVPSAPVEATPVVPEPEITKPEPVEEPTGLEKVHIPTLVPDENPRGLEKISANQVAEQLPVIDIPNQEAAPLSPLDEARRKFAEAEKNLPKNPTFSESMEFAEIEANYKKLRAEFVGASAEYFLVEKIALTEARLEAYANREQTAYEKLKAVNNWLGDINLADKGIFKGKLRRVGKFLNARTAISAGLMGLGLQSENQIFRGITTGISVANLVKSAREAHLGKQVTGKETYDEAEKMLTAMVSRAMLDGKNKELLEDPNYQKLINRQKEVLQSIETSPGLLKESDRTLIAEFLDARNEETSSALKKQLKTERRWNRVAAGAGIGAGIVIGSGWWGAVMKEGMKGIGHAVDYLKHGGSVELNVPHSPATEVAIAKDIELPAETSEIPNTIEAQDTLSVMATDRGLEGTILGLKTGQPERYQAMIEWLKHQDYNKDVTDEGALVHRFMLDYAKNHDMTIDTGGPKDLSKIFSGEIGIKPDGSIEFGTGKESIEFVPEKSSPTIESLSERTVPFNEESTVEPDLNVEIPHPQQVSSAGGVPEIKETWVGPDEASLYTSKLRESFGGSVSERLNTVQEGIDYDPTKNSVENLEIIVGSEYRKFLRDNYQMSARDFNKISKRSISQFLIDYRKNSPSFQEHYLGLYKTLSANKENLNGTMNLRDYILGAAKKYKSA